MELSGAGLRSWEALAERHGVAVGPLVRAVGVYLLDFEQLTGDDVAVVVSLARGLEEAAPRQVDLREAEADGVLGALNAAVDAVDRAKKLLEQAGHREAARSLGEAQPSLHDARRTFRASSPPPHA